MLINKKRVKVSRRDAFLGLFGIAYILLGYSFLNIDPVLKPLIHAQLRLALDVAPVEVYGALWITAGAVAAIAAVHRKWDDVGYGVATGMPMLWSTAYWAAEIQDHVPRAWVSGIVYLVLGSAVWLVSGMHDPLAYRPAPTPETTDDA